MDSPMANSASPGLGQGPRENRISLYLAGTLTVVWMAFILMVGFAKPTLAIQVASGLTLGLLFAFVVVILVWLLALFYFIFGNRQASDIDDSSRGSRP
jgi:uncharacterized membrane protein (DUF485 family)